MRNDAIKVKDLARELGVSSRSLIDRCRLEGIPVQNSISKLTSAQADKVRGWIARAPVNGADAQESNPEE